MNYEARDDDVHHPDRETSVDGAEDVSWRRANQKRLLLPAFWYADELGLTDDEAAYAAGLRPTSCFWKRCSEMRSDGLIEYLPRKRRGPHADAWRQISVITDYGRTEQHRLRLYLSDDQAHAAVAYAFKTYTEIEEDSAEPSEE